MYTFQVIYTLLNKETKGDMLPVPSLSIGGKTKTMKKDEQYRVMYAELEKFLAAHEHSERHAKVRLVRSATIYPC